MFQCLGSKQYPFPDILAEYTALRGIFDD